VRECKQLKPRNKRQADAEVSFRRQEDCISKYRRVLEYFDAVKIGLTAPRIRRKSLATRSLPMPGRRSLAAT
jgi:hypothetical protein